MTEIAGRRRRQAPHRAAAATTRWPPTCGCSPSDGRRRADRCGRATSQQVLLDRAAEAGDTYLPGYTHLQRAQPVLLAHHLLAHAWALPATSTGCSTPGAAWTCRPSGAGALAGSSLPLDPDGVAADLGFAAASRTRLDAVERPRLRRRDPLRPGPARRAPLRLGEEVVLWSSEEFGFLAPRRRLGDRAARCSRRRRTPTSPSWPGARRAGSIGAPDRAAGHPEGAPARLQPRPPGGQGAAVRRGRPDQLGPGRPGRADGQRRLRRPPHAEAADTPSAAAVDLAEWLVADGMPFRDAHALVGVAGEGLDRTPCPVGRIGGGPPGPGQPGDRRCWNRAWPLPGAPRRAEGAPNPWPRRSAASASASRSIASASGRCSRRGRAGHARGVCAGPGVVRA